MSYYGKKNFRLTNLLRSFFAWFLVYYGFLYLFLMIIFALLGKIKYICVIKGRKNKNVGGL